LAWLAHLLARRALCSLQDKRGSMLICMRLACLYAAAIWLKRRPRRDPQAISGQKVGMAALPSSARAIGDCFIAKAVEATEIRGFLQDELNTGH
jgi:hypothetical protein